jgi:hypothetical protein
MFLASFWMGKRLGVNDAHECSRVLDAQTVLYDQCFFVHPVGNGFPGERDHVAMPCQTSSARAHRNCTPLMDGIVMAAALKSHKCTVSQSLTGSARM